jgi:hypothetical protein
MKHSVLVLLIACAWVTLPAHAQAVRNPLRPPDLGAAAATTAPAPGLGLPETRPGAYIAGRRPLLPPPPPGLPPLELPPAAPALDRPSALQPHPPAEGGAAHQPGPGGLGLPDAADPAQGEAVGPTPARKGSSTVFLSRDALRQSRAHCIVELKHKAPLQFTTAGGDQVVRLRVSGGRACVKALSSSHDWLRVSALSGDNELTVSVDENEEPEAREGEVVVANTGAAVRILVRQAPNTSGFRRIAL